MELRTRVYPMEARYYCEKCAVFLDEGTEENPVEKNPDWKYLPKEEFDKITDHVVDDSVLNVMTMNQILSVLLSIRDHDKEVEYFADQKDKTDPTVKFFGEMEYRGFANETAPEYLHQCNNPSCKQEILLSNKYPYVDQTVGRVVRVSEELQHPDEVIRNVIKKHIGSTVNSDFVDTGKKDEPEKTDGEA